jgi:hypothetical protein
VKQLGCPNCELEKAMLNRVAPRDVIGDWLSSLAGNSHSLRFCPQLLLPIVDTDHDGTISLDEAEAIKSDPLGEDTLEASGILARTL